MDNILKPGLVTFATENSVTENNKNTLINATAIAKPFGKRPADWLRLRSAQRFLSHLAAMKNIPPAGLVNKITSGKDGKQKDIWIHEDAALEFARWLSPSFAVWNNQRTKELLLNGKTETQREMQLPWVVSDLLVNKVGELENAMNEQARKAVYHDAVLQSRTLIPANVIAKELGMSAIALNRLLRDKKIIYKSNDHWVLYADYQGKGYTGTKTALYIDSQGKYQSNIHTYWTEKGREFIHAVIKEVKQIA